MGKRYKRYVLILAVVVVILNIIAWCSKSFCDWYIGNIFFVWVSTYGRFMGIFPFSVGEIMLVLGSLLILAGVIIGILFFVLKKKDKYKAFARQFYKVFLVIFLNVCLVMTLNCTLLYHCTPLDANKEYEKRQYTIDELEKLYVYAIEQSNLYAGRIKRDEKGHATYDGDMKINAINAMKNISDDYRRLKGYYPKIKDMLFSNLMCQAYMCGYYFPFSMEANVNKKMYITNFPPTYCHELSHLHGYIYEDEANFLGFLACIKSEDDFFIYSGYLSVLGYIQDAYYESISKLSDEEWNERVNSLPHISDKVLDDSVFLLPETWEEVESSAVISTGKVEEVTDAFTDTSLKLNGVSDGMAAYDRVVGLLLEYYEGELF